MTLAYWHTSLHSSCQLHKLWHSLLAGNNVLLLVSAKDLMVGVF